MMSDLPAVVPAVAPAVTPAVTPAVPPAVTPAVVPAATKPTLRWVLGHPARIIAFGAGSGLLKPGPGTWGTLFAWITFAPMAAWFQGVAGLPGAAILALPVAAFLLGIWACGRAARDLGIADPGGIVWDEVAAFWLVLALMPAGPGAWGAQLAAFGLFRFFDIVKPPPIRQFDANLKGGFGVMFDDLLAAFYTLLVIALWTRWTA